MINKSLWKNDIIICITLDLDWASEDCLKNSLSLLEDYGLSSTYFLTHPSKIMSDKIRKGEIHAGIHPNFLKNSTQGKNIDDVLDYLIKILPEADCFRVHKYFDNNDITDKMVQRGFKYDSNLCTKMDLVEPFYHRSGLIRFPIYFEDGAYLLHKNNLLFKEMKRNFFSRPGLYVFNLHPMHLALNSPTYTYMRKIKDNITYNAWNNLTFAELNHLSYKGLGIRSFITELFKYIKKENLQVVNLEEAFRSIFI